jgi:hypothetical protein
VRKVRKRLYDSVIDVVSKIVQASESGDADVEQVELSRLRTLYVRHEALGVPDPFLTEAMADYTDEASEAVSLYRLALLQSAQHSDEPTHTKRICLAERLTELGDLKTARAELLLGRAEAQRLNDNDYIKMADELLAKIS